MAAHSIVNPSSIVALDMALAEPYRAFNVCLGKLFCWANVKLLPLPAINIPYTKHYTGGHVPPQLQSFLNSIKDGKVIITPPTNTSIIRDKVANSQRMVKLVSVGPGQMRSYFIPNTGGVGWMRFAVARTALRSGSGAGV